MTVSGASKIVRALFTVVLIGAGSSLGAGAGAASAFHLIAAIFPRHWGRGLMEDTQISGAIVGGIVGIAVGGVGAAVVGDHLWRKLSRMP